MTDEDKPIDKYHWNIKSTQKKDKADTAINKKQNLFRPTVLLNWYTGKENSINRKSCRFDEESYFNEWNN